MQIADSIFERLDLQKHIEQFESFFSRKSSLYMQGDQELHFNYIKSLENKEFKAPPKISSLSNIKNHLNKYGILNFEQIFEIIKITRYFGYLKNCKLDGILSDWIDKIIIDDRFLKIDEYFKYDGKFNESLDEHLLELGLKIDEYKLNINSLLKKITSSSKLSEYLVDTQIHLINHEECLLVRGGFNHILKGNILGRTTAGFFYVSPDSITKTKEKIRYIEQERNNRFYLYAKDFSTTLWELKLFIKFIDKEFSKFDNYQARVFFARSKNLQIIKSKNHSKIIINNFIHPAIHNPKPIDVDFNKNILMITGVNAGGKTMLLKSILACAFMAKYIIPMNINSIKSDIGSFKNILSIIDDPQNVKNDISTFAGRMQEFSSIFSYKSALVGIDEIELGTDSDEAAALFKVILDKLVEKGQKIIVTTHHKRLASLMADRDDVELVAAIYNEELREPTYEFMHGIIGKSYAFETAIRYGISNNIVEEAKKIYGDNSQKLNLLIERGSQLERELKQKHKLIDEKILKLKTKKLILEEEETNLTLQFNIKEKELIKSYQDAINLAKKAANAGDIKAIHRAMTKAKNNLPEKQNINIVQKIDNFKVGDIVKYHSQIGKIIFINSKNDVGIEIDGMRLRAEAKNIKHSKSLPKLKTSNLSVLVKKRAGLKCDLHGKRAEEALEILDKFLSDALISGWDEVVVYHGIGTGKLSYAVKKFLLSHPSVKKFEDAPQHIGGFGAKIVSL